MKQINKTETTQEFLARGGKVTIVSMQTSKKKRAYEKKQESETTDVIDENLIPEALKITLGMR